MSNFGWKMYLVTWLLAFSKIKTSADRFTKPYYASTPLWVTVISVMILQFCWEVRLASFNLLVLRKSPSPVRRRELSLDKQLELITRKRPSEAREPSPPSKASKQDDIEDTGFIDLLSKIPRDVKLTRAQFEELMTAHQARRAAAADNKPSM